MSLRKSHEKGECLQHIRDRKEGKMTHANHFNYLSFSCNLPECICHSGTQLLSAHYFSGTVLGTVSVFVNKTESLSSWDLFVR